MSPFDIWSQGLTDDIFNKEGNSCVYWRIQVASSYQVEKLSFRGLEGHRFLLPQCCNSCRAAMQLDISKTIKRKWFKVIGCELYKTYIENSTWLQVKTLAQEWKSAVDCNLDPSPCGCLSSFRGEWTICPRYVRTPTRSPGRAPRTGIPSCRRLAGSRWAKTPPAASPRPQGSRPPTGAPTPRPRLAGTLPLDPEARERRSVIHGRWFTHKNGVDWFTLVCSWEKLLQHFPA